jgi:hypothetical protein
VKRKLTFALLLLFLGSTYLPILSNAQAPSANTATIPKQVSNIAILVDPTASDSTPLFQTRRMLEYKGLVYQIVTNMDLKD